MVQRFPDYEAAMRCAIELGQRGEGAVEPNPMVGAVVVDDDLQVLGEGWHERFGEPHAEVNALRAAGSCARGTTLVVTLEPCCHHGKTPPCTEAVIKAGIKRVYVGLADPFSEVSGQGIAQLREAGIDVQVGLLEADVRELNAPFIKLITSSMPFVHAKWAMTLDGKIATRTGHSKWISNESSRRVVHELRGRMDAIVVGIGTAIADDPMLTARPPGPRSPARVVIDSTARLPLDSRLIQTAQQTPVILVADRSVPEDRVDALRQAGVEVLRLSGTPPEGANEKAIRIELGELLHDFGSRKFTNVLIEGGSGLLGAFHDQNLIDEVHIFIAPKIAGGANAFTAVGGTGLECMPAERSLEAMEIKHFEGDIYVRGRVSRG